MVAYNDEMETLTKQSLRLTENAVARLKAIHAESASLESGSKDTSSPPVLRVTVDAGGCSGFQYHFQVEGMASVSNKDCVIQQDGVVLVTDPVSLDLLAGSEVDFKQELIGAAFTIKNPNANSSCGCGSSFAL